MPIAVDLTQEPSLEATSKFVILSIISVYLAVIKPMHRFLCRSECGYTNINVLQN